MILLLVFAILVAVVAAIFALGNTAAVTVAFLSFKFHGSLAVVLMIVFGLGILTAAAALLPGFLAAKWRVRSLKRRLRQAALPDDPDAEGPPPSDPEGNN